MDIGQKIIDFFAGTGNNWAVYVAGLSILGGVTMALLQTIKDLTPVRQWYQRRRLRDWIAAGATRATTAFGMPVDPVLAESDLLIMAVNGDSAALYDLQIEQLCGQFTSAIQMVLEFPASHKDLLAVTASRALPADIALVLAPPSPPNQALADARARVTHQCQRAIDGFQITTSFRWKWWLQTASIVLAIVLAEIALHGEDFRRVLGSAVIAGFLAPVAKDLVAVINQARGK